MLLAVWQGMLFSGIEYHFYEVVSPLATISGSTAKSGSALQTVRYAAGALRNVAVEEAGRQQVLASVGALGRLQGGLIIDPTPVHECSIHTCAA